MSWLDKIAKKRLAELEEHPELNEQNYSQKLNSIIFCEYPSDDPIQQVDINNVNISSSIALSKDCAIYELQTK